MASQVALFVDRDGVLIEDRVNYARSWDEVQIIEPAVEALQAAHEAGLPIIVITNQSAVGRNVMSYEEVHALNERIMDYFRGRGIPILAGYFCPHIPEDECNCRKPKPGMFLQAAEDHGIDLSRSYMLGDARRDMEAASAAGVTGLFVQTGQGPQHYAKMSEEDRTTWPAFDNALGAVRHIVDGLN